ncbi:unnamed protein product [Soboliphyme baturini]|uniref:Transmembrane protein 204 n=1 Tax=Soboliphyme baturini TaxID=241478 RepID=A0A183IQN4_9BILA|nr:unnamed protein product [Soboliphyme baturini]
MSFLQNGPGWFLQLVCGLQPLCRQVPTAQFTYFLLLLMWLAAAGVEVWVTTILRRRYGDQNEWYRRRAAASAFCFANMIVNALCMYYVNPYGP